MIPLKLTHNDKGLFGISHHLIEGNAYGSSIYSYLWVKQDGNCEKFITHCSSIYLKEHTKFDLFEHTMEYHESILTRIFLEVISGDTSRYNGNIKSHYYKILLSPLEPITSEEMQKACGIKKVEEHA